MKSAKVIHHPLYDGENFSTVQDEIENLRSGIGITFSGGTIALPGISYSGDLNTGIAHPSADVMAMSTNGGLGRISIGELGPGTATFYSSANELRWAVSDTSMQLHYDNIVLGLSDGSSHPPNVTWKLPDHDNSNSGGDHALCSLTAVENSSTYPYSMQYTAGTASGTKLSHVFLTLDSGGNSTPRLYIPAGNDDGAVSIGTVAPTGDVAGTLLHLHGINAGSYSHVHFTNADTGAAGSDGCYIGINASEQVRIWNKESTEILYGMADAEIARWTTSGNLKIGGTASRSTTSGTHNINLYDGTAPSGTLANGVTLYSASGELRSMDSAGNSTLLSPHDKVTNEWIYDSVDTRTGKHLRIDMERMMRAINEKFGWDFVHDFVVEESGG